MRIRNPGASTIRTGIPRARYSTTSRKTSAGERIHKKFAGSKGKIAQGTGRVHGSLLQKEIAITGLRTVRLGNTGPRRGEAAQGKTKEIHTRRGPRSQETTRRIAENKKDSRVKIRVSGGNAVCAKARWNKKMVHGFTTY
jgi:hypothetical protein